jgi:regulator of nucleoside diphosphate kinase
MIALKDTLKPGRQVRIVRQMPQRDQCWTPSVEGTLVSIRQEPTGAWWAHSKKHKLWLDRATVRMDDGELTDVVLDDYTRVESLQGPASAAMPVVNSAGAATAAVDVGGRRWAAAFVSVLALATFALAAAMIPLRLVAIGALCFFLLALWMSSPVLIAVLNTAGHQFGAVVARLRHEDHRPAAEARTGPLRTRTSPRALRPRGARRSARRLSTTHKPFLNHTRIHAMKGYNAVITTRDFERLQDLTQSPQSQFYGPMTALENGLRRGSVVASCKVGKDIVTMNSRVRVRDMQNGDQETYTLAYPPDADIDEGRISVLAPLGAALLGAKARGVVVVSTPRGDRKLRIERILYQPEAAGDYHL